MMTRDELLVPLARIRTDEVVVTTMSTTRPWGRLSDRDLDFASADSAMGHAADLALGIALARPERTVLCLNGDGSMLMSLGTLALAVESGASNFLLFVVDNGSYEITGHQPYPGAGKLDFGGLAKAAGFPLVFRFDDAAAYAEAVPDLLRAPGPTFVHALVEKGTEGPISRSSSEHARYLQSSLAGWSRTMRTALTASDDADE
jgi:thiamine pyrophosphate-dependent acetolactate synthase large subunit-like protein